MAILRDTKISSTGNQNAGFTIHLTSSVNFLSVDLQLNLEYSAQAFLYDEDFGSDILVPLIENLYCTAGLQTVSDRKDGGDDLISKRNLGRFKASSTPKQLEYKFQIQKGISEAGLLVSRSTLKALSDEASNSRELELRGIIILTNELNGIAISRSSVVSVPVLDQVIL